MSFPPVPGSPQPEPVAPPTPGPEFVMPPMPGAGRGPGPVQGPVLVLPKNAPATASLILGLVSLVTSVLFAPAVVAFVLGVVGLNRSGRTTPPMGRGKALAGIVLSVFSVVVGVLILGAIASSSPQGKADASLDNVAQSAPAEDTAADEHAAEPDEAPVYDLADFVPVDAGTWDAVAKNPDGAEGDMIVVFAEVTQFDAATGTDTFRANVGVDQPAAEFELETNAVLSADEVLLSGIVAGDVLKVYAVVAGSLEYETQIGGATTVPLLAIAKVEDVGYADLSKDVVLGAPARDEFGYLTIPGTITNSGSKPFTYSVDVVAESSDGATSYGTASAFADNLNPGQNTNVTFDFFEEIPDGAVFRIATADRYGN